MRIAIGLLAIVTTISTAEFASGDPDDHGNTCAEGTPVMPDAQGRSYSGILEPGDPADWFRMAVSPGRLYRVRVTSSLNDSEPRVSLVGADCRSLLDQIEMAWGQTELNAVAASNSMSVAFEVSDYPIGPYTFFVQDLGPAADDFPRYPDATSPSVAPGAAVTGRIDFRGDADAFRIMLPARSIFSLEASAEAAGCAVYVEVFDGDRRLGQAYGNPGAGGAYSPPAVFVTPENVSPNPWVRVSVGYQDSREVGGYRFRILPMGTVPIGDDHGDDAQHATPVAAGGAPVDGVLQPPSDADWFVVATRAGYLYQYAIVVKTPAGSINAAIFDPRQPAPMQTDRLYGQSNTRSFYSEAGGPMFIRMAHDETAFTDVGLYSVRVTELGAVPDDGPNLPAEAAMLPLEELQTGSIDYQNDPDWYRAQFDADRLYRVEIRGDSTGLGIFTMAGIQIGWASSNESVPGTLGWRFATLVTPHASEPMGYLLKVSDSSAGIYQLRARDFGPIHGSDGAATCQTALRFAPDGQRRRAFVSEEQPETWASCDVQRGRRYALRLLDRSIGAELDVRSVLDCATPLIRTFDPGWPSPPAEFEPRSDSQLDLKFRTLDGQSGSIEFAVEDIGAATDVEANDGASASPEPVGRSPIRGRIDHIDDADVFRVRLRPGGRYRLELQGTGDGCCSLHAAVGQVAFTHPAMAEVQLYRSDSNVDSVWVRSEFTASASAGDASLGIYGDSWNVSGYQVRIVNAECRGDWNDDGAVSVSDVLSFLTDWLADDGDFDGLDGSTLGDLFDFLNAFFAGCS